MKCDLEAARRYREFLDQYYDKYPDHIKPFLPKTLGEDIIRDNILDDALEQIYSEIGYISEERNRYLAYLKLIKTYHDIGGNILEIGGGFFPILSKYIDQEQQKIGRGTITVYDPELIVDHLGNINLIKAEYNTSIDISNIDTIVIVRTHEVVETGIKMAIRYKKDLFNAFCSCAPDNNPYKTPLLWRSAMINLARRKAPENSQFRSLNLDPSYHVELPIISISQENQKLR